MTATAHSLSHVFLDNRKIFEWVAHTRSRANGRSQQNQESALFPPKKIKNNKNRESQTIRLRTIDSNASYYYEWKFIYIYFSNFLFNWFSALFFFTTFFIEKSSFHARLIIHVDFFIFHYLGFGRTCTILFEYKFHNFTRQKQTMWEKASFPCFREKENPFGRKYLIDVYTFSLFFFLPPLVIPYWKTLVFLIRGDLLLRCESKSKQQHVE